MITWGISANSHDAALAVFCDGQLEFASHSERFSKIKNDKDLCSEIVDYARLWGEPNEIVWYENPYLKTLRQLTAGQGWKWSDNNIRNYLKSYGINAPIKYSGHHASHAAGGYYTSNFEDATIICLDSIGEFETFTIWSASKDRLKKVYKQNYPNSLGLWYSAMTQRCYLKPNEDEYILMGMAAYGDANRLLDKIHNDFFDTTATEPFKLKVNLHRGCLNWAHEFNVKDVFDIAAATQKLYEFYFEKIVKFSLERNKSNNLVLMGGCALNCSANHIAKKYYNNVWIMPNPGDAGSAIGAVLAKTKRHIAWQGPYLGYNIEGEYPVEKLLTELKQNKIVGVANGRAEYGPRALGNRSLLADPRDSNIKDRVNDIKQRQKFRPFAPAILEEHAGDYFEGSTGPYMQFTSRCRFPELYPAIVHADGTSRVQTVSSKDSTGLRKLLERWYEETGCPMLLNTSLNIKGKPIVNNLTDAENFAKMYNVKVYS